MNKEEFKNKISDIGTTEKVEDIRTKLTELQDEMSKVFDDIETDKTTISTLNSKIEDKDKDLEDLRKANMQLFLKVGETKTPEQVKEASTGVKEEPEANKRKFEDLFKEEK